MCTKRYQIQQEFSPLSQKTQHKYTNQMQTDRMGRNKEGRRFVGVHGPASVGGVPCVFGEGGGGGSELIWHLPMRNPSRPALLGTNRTVLGKPACTHVFYDQTQAFAQIKTIASPRRPNPKQDSISDGHIVRQCSLQCAFMHCFKAYTGGGYLSGGQHLWKILSDLWQIVCECVI